MLMWNFSLVGAIFFFLGAQADVSGLDGRHRHFSPFWRMNEEAQNIIPIGICWIEEDGTIVLDLRRTADGINISMPPQRFARTHSRYEEVLRHVGPLRPGEVKLVAPWPD
jgi:hypothetical protein